jgi:hypothetical protein
MLDPHVHLVTEFAEAAAARAARRVVRHLQGLAGDSLLSGPDSGLVNVWEEICVQVQFQESVFWGAYVSVVEQYTAPVVAAMPQREGRAMWLQTPDGEQWWEDLDGEGLTPEVPTEQGAVVAYVVRRVLEIAADWSNPRIRSYLRASTLK